MTFVVPCPGCGPREAGEFRFGGESTRRPSPEASLEELATYLFFRRNAAGEQVEWWYHDAGCQRWFLARRDTTTNVVREVWWPEQKS